MEIKKHGRLQQGQSSRFGHFSNTHMHARFGHPTDQGDSGGNNHQRCARCAHAACPSDPGVSQAPPAPPQLQPWVRDSPHRLPCPATCPLARLRSFGVLEGNDHRAGVVRVAVGPVERHLHGVSDQRLCGLLRGAPRVQGAHHQRHCFAVRYLRATVPVQSNQQVRGLPGATNMAPLWPAERCTPTAERTSPARRPHCA